MKVFRIQHKSTRRGMFTSRFHPDSREYELQTKILNELREAYRAAPHLLPDAAIDMSESEVELFTEYVNSGGIFGCLDPEHTAAWILRSKSLLSKMIECGYCLYQYDINEDEIYKFSSQVTFKRKNIVRRKKLDFEKVLAPFLTENGVI